ASEPCRRGGRSRARRCADVGGACARAGPRTGEREGVLLLALAPRGRRRAGDRPARQLRRGSTRPPARADRRRPCLEDAARLSGRVLRPRGEAGPRPLPPLVLGREPPQARHAGGADRGQARNGVTAAVACFDVSTFGRSGAGTIAPAAMFVSTLRCRDSHAPISAATPFSSSLWSGVTAPM